MGKGLSFKEHCLYKDSKFWERWAQEGLIIAGKHVQDLRRKVVSSQSNR